MKNLLQSLLFFVVAALLISTASCKKDKSNSAANCKLTVLQNTASDTSAVTYDAQGRVATYGNIHSGLYTFNYSGLTATTTVTTSDTSWHEQMHIFLNSDGHVVSMNEDRAVGGSTYHYTYTFTYDADGHIVLDEESYHDVSTLSTSYTKDSLVYVDGNMVAKYTFNKDNLNPYVLYDSVILSYTTMPNKNGYYIWRYVEEPISQLSGWAAYYHLFGNSSKNLPSSSKYYTVSGGLIYQYAYSFLQNQNGYVTDENLSFTGIFSGTYNRTFAYSCN